MKQVVQLLNIIVLAGLLVAPVFNSAVSGQDVQSAYRLVICGGGDLPDTVYKKFRAMAGPETKLVVIPTASKNDINVEKIQKLWQSRGFQEVSILHTYTMPRVYNLMNDPREIDNVLFPHTWVLKAGLPQLEEHVVSLKKYPPIPTGTPDPYQPPNKV